MIGKETIAVATLSIRAQSLGGTSACVQDLFEATGLRTSERLMGLWVIGKQIPHAQLVASHVEPTPRWMVNKWLGIEEDDWWTADRGEEEPSIDGLNPPGGWDDVDRD